MPKKDRRQNIYLTYERKKVKVKSLKVKVQKIVFVLLTVQFLHPLRYIQIRR